jgi:hypothetical protein
MSMLVVAAPITWVASRQAARATMAAAPLISSLQFPQLHASHRVIATLLQNQIGPLTRWHHVLAQVDQVDRPPDGASGIDRLLRRE